MSIERRNAFLEAANMCEAEIATGDPGTLNGAAEMRMGATAALKTMARILRRAAEHATTPTEARHLRALPKGSTDV